MVRMICWQVLKLNYTETKLAIELSSDDTKPKTKTMNKEPYYEPIRKYTKRITDLQRIIKSFAQN